MQKGRVVLALDLSSTALVCLAVVPCREVDRTPDLREQGEGQVNQWKRRGSAEGSGREVSPSEALFSACAVR